MKIIKHLGIILLASILWACTSVEPVKYYSLALNTDHKAPNNNNQSTIDKPRVVVGPVHLAIFLRQEGIVMQIGEHEIYTASYHSWAEPLDEAIAKLLVQQLNKKSKSYQFERMMGRWNQNAEFDLRLDFEQFHATDDAKIYVSGRYWFYKKDKILKIDKTFNISEKLTHDGYLHSVEKLKQAMDKLSDKIIVSRDHL